MKNLNYQLLESAISEQRLIPYLKKANNDHDLAVSLYLKNLEYCKTVYFNLHWLEIILRNSINNQLIKDYQDNWYDNEKMNFGEIELAKIQNAKNIITKESKLMSNPNIIANLSFGFWVNLFNGRYENLWRHSLRKIFLNTDNLLRKDISKRLHPVLKLRNRIAHYEHLNNYNLVDYKNNFTDVLNWINPDFVSFIH